MVVGDSQKGRVKVVDLEGQRIESKGCFQGISRRKEMQVTCSLGNWQRGRVVSSGLQRSG